MLQKEAKEAGQVLERGQYIRKVSLHKEGAVKKRKLKGEGLKGEVLWAICN